MLRSLLISNLYYNYPIQKVPLDLKKAIGGKKVEGGWNLAFFQILRVMFSYKNC